MLIFLVPNPKYSPGEGLLLRVLAHVLTDLLCVGMRVDTRYNCACWTKPTLVSLFAVFSLGCRGESNTFRTGTE